VQVSVYDDDHVLDDILQLGWSPYPMLALLILGIVVLVTPVVIASKKFRSSMPMVRSYSFAIAAACHPPADETDAFKSALQWGEVAVTGERSGLFGHCSFSMHEVGDLQQGKPYE
jgi:hypothetical protein